MEMHSSSFSRRGFVAGAAGGLAASVYAQIPGANDRLRIAIAGPGAQGSGLLREFLRQAPEMNAEMVAVCDLWVKRQDRAAGVVKQATGKEPRKIQHLEEVLAMKDIDGVIIATPDHAHSPQLVQAIQAGKDVYVEKPMGTPQLAPLKKAYAVAKASKQVVQVGTQGMSSGNYQAAAEYARSGRLGRISRVLHEAVWMGQVWRPVPAAKEIRESETDWNAWLMGHRKRPFDPNLYFEYRVYREFSNGLADQWLSHSLAMVHHVMDDYFPVSVVANGGTYLYKDGRENPDTFAVTYTYPRGFIYSWAAAFGNDYPGVTRFYGENGTLENSAKGYVARPLGGRRLPTKLTGETVLPPINPTSHMRNWLECMRTRKTPNADVRSGYAASVAAIMAQQSDITGKRLYWDSQKEEIVDRPV